MAEGQRVGEVVAASTADFIAQCYELDQSPPLGSLVKTGEPPLELYGVVYNATTASLDPGRRPIARGKDEASEADIYRANPQLLELLHSEFSTMVVAYRQDGKWHHYLPPKPARIHGFVYLCLTEEVREFSQSLSFLTLLLNTHLPIPQHELVAACLRYLSQAHEDRHAFLTAAGKELAVLLSGQFDQLKAILERIKQ